MAELGGSCRGREIAELEVLAEQVLEPCAVDDVLVPLGALYANHDRAHAYR